MVFLLDARYENLSSMLFLELPYKRLPAAQTAQELIVRNMSSNQDLIFRYRSLKKYLARF